MSELLIKWLNSEIHLSKEITNISEDFKSGYLFAEILSKTKQLHTLHEFRNSSNKKEIDERTKKVNDELSTVLPKMEAAKQAIGNMSSKSVSALRALQKENPNTKTALKW